MIARLQKEDLVNLVCGVELPAFLSQHPLINKLGTEYGGQGGFEWSWNKNELKKLSESDLSSIYRLITSEGGKKVSFKIYQGGNRKAMNWDALGEEIAECYMEESENTDLGTIGEKAARAYGWL